MRGVLHMEKVWPLLRNLVSSRACQSGGGLSTLFPPLALTNERHMLGAVLQIQSQALHQDNGENGTFQQWKANEHGPTSADKAARERSWKDALLSSPGALSVDNVADRLFITDTFHHRIIVTDGGGKILDCIGSSPGMQDGPFETAQFCYPACTLFEANENCLYIADSENHAIRKADLRGRLLSTLYPTKVLKSESSFWERVLTWIGAVRSRDADREDEEARLCMLRYPWHLEYAQEGSLLVANRRLENLWELDSTSGRVSELHDLDSHDPLEEFLSKVLRSKEIGAFLSLIQGMEGNDTPTERPRLVEYVSRALKMKNRFLLVYTENGVISKWDLDTRRTDTLCLSNLGLLGLPWWWSVPSLGLQSPNSDSSSNGWARSTHQATQNYHEIRVQSGRCLLCISPLLPSGTILAAPVDDGSIWRQARGSVVELSTFGGSLITHKVSGAQQWVDDLEDLDDSNTEELTIPERSRTGIPFYSLVDASLGKGEVIIDAAVYLKRSVYTGFSDDSAGSMETPTGWQMSAEYLHQDRVFLAHLHVRVRLEVSTSASEQRIKYISVQI